MTIKNHIVLDPSYTFRVVGLFSYKMHTSYSTTNIGRACVIRPPVSIKTTYFESPR